MNVPDRKRLIILSISWLFLFCVAVAGFYLLEKARFKDLLSLIEAREQVLFEYAALLRENTATQDVQQLVNDCSGDDRAAYDRLLGNVSTLNHSELEALQAVFTDCAYQHPHQQAIMSLLFSHEFAAFNAMLTSVESSAIFTDTKMNERMLWRKLVELETSRSNLARELVDVQGRILSSLLAGTPTTDPSHEIEMQHASEILEQMVTAKAEIELLHAELHKQS